MEDTEKKEEEKEVFNKVEEMEYSAVPPPYIIGKLFNEVEVITEFEGEVRFVVSELECEYAWSKPCGKRYGNKSISSEFFRKKNVTQWKNSKNIKQTVYRRGGVTNENFVTIGEERFKKSTQDLAVSDYFLCV